MPYEKLGRRIVAATTALVIASAIVVATPAAASSPVVSPINFSSFATIPVDSISVQLRGVLRNANKFAVTTWWNTQKDFDAQAANTYLNFGGTDEVAIRGAAAEAVSLATSLRLGIYDPAVTGVPTATAQAMLVKLVASLAHAHFSNSSPGWGVASAPSGTPLSLGWQTALWAALAGQAGWISWDYLSTGQREEVRRMVEAEADRFIGWTVPYYRNTSGTVLYPGDSKAEELAWNANILQLAVAMMPDHANYQAWMQKRIELSLGSYARPEDLAPANINKPVNGRTLGQWLGGSNVYDDGTVVNHNLVHPGYMTFPTITVMGVVNQSLAGQPTPFADVRGFPAVYDALVDVVWTPGPKPSQYSVDTAITSSIGQPGGHVYNGTSTVPGATTDIYYPMGNDWGVGGRMEFAFMDVIGTSVQTPFGYLDSWASTGGAYWAGIHLTRVGNMQARFTDRRTFAPGENTYYGREEYVAQMAAQAYLVRFLSANSRIIISTGSF